MTKIFKQRKAELEKGCGEVIDWDNKFSDPAYVCRNGFLCPKCEAELKGLQEGYDLAKAEDLKIIDNCCNPKSTLQERMANSIKAEISKESTK